MKHKWPRIKIFQLCDLIVDCVNKTAPSVEYVTPFKMIRTSNVKNGVINLKDCKYVEKEVYEKWTRRANVNKGDIILTREAPMGEVGLVTIQDTLFLGQRVMQYRANPNKLDPNFLLYSFLSPDLQFQFRRYNNGGSIVSHICVPDCFQFEISTPPIKIQKQTAKILSDLDAKIELNNKINTELEAMAKLIYDYWFVQFDFPDENKKPYKSSGGKMVWSEELKREIPKGWNIDNLGNYAEVKKGELITAKDSKIGNIKVVAAGINYSYKHDIPNRSANTVTISGSGANAGFINFWREPIFASDCITLRGETDTITLMLFHHLRLLQNYIFSQATGSAQPHVYPTDIKILQYAIPPKNLIEKFGLLIIPMNNKIANNLKENDNLTELRNWLLPMLMNGQVTISENNSIVKVDRSETISDHYQQRKALAIYILSQSSIDISLGRVKFEKLLHLSEYHIVKEQLNQQYIQYAAGPLDTAFTYDFFKEAEADGIISFKSHGSLQRIVVNTEAIKNVAFNLGEEVRLKINALIKEFMGSNYEKPEIISTLYAVWNNRIIQNEMITDELLKQDFLAWDEQKAKYKDQLDRNLNWMRSKGYVPNGWGEVIGEKTTKKKN